VSPFFHIIYLVYINTNQCFQFNRVVGKTSSQQIQVMYPKLELFRLKLLILASQFMTLIFNYFLCHV